MCSPSTRISPFITFSFSNTFTFFHFGINSSLKLSSASFIKILFLSFVSFPKITVPEVSASIAGSLGFLASKISATRGNPPVISFTFEVSFGILAIMSPILIF